MAIRVPDSISIEPRTNIQADVANKNQRLVIKNRSFGIAGELESCASNDLPFQFESKSETVEEENEDLKTEKSGNKASISKRKSVASYKTQRRHNSRVKGKTTQCIEGFRVLSISNILTIYVKCFRIFFCSFRQRKEICNNRQRKLRRPRSHPQAARWETNAKKHRKSYIATAEIIFLCKSLRLIVWTFGN